MKHAIAATLCLVAIGMFALAAGEVRVGQVHTETAFFDVYTGSARAYADYERQSNPVCEMTVGNSWSHKIPGGPNDYFQFIDLASAEQLRFWGIYDLRVQDTSNYASMGIDSLHNGVRWTRAVRITHGNPELPLGGDLSGYLYGSYKTESPHLTQTYRAIVNITTTGHYPFVGCSTTFNMYVYQS